MKKNISKKISKKNNNQISVPRVLNKNTVCIEATVPIFMRTGQLQCSFSVASQVYFLNLSNLIVASNNFQKLATSGVMNSEFLQCRGMSVKWFPGLIVPVSGTFEPSAFDVRYIPFMASDTILPSGYYGNYNASQMSVLLAQSNRPQSWNISFPNTPVSNENNRQCLGSFLSSFNFYNYASQHGGMLTLIQTTPSLNTISTYNPKLGFLELKFYIDVFNSIV